MTQTMLCRNPSVQNSSFYNTEGDSPGDSEFSDSDSDSELYITVSLPSKAQPFHQTLLQTLDACIIVTVEVENLNGMPQLNCATSECVMGPGLCNLPGEKEFISLMVKDLLTPRDCRFNLTFSLAVERALCPTDYPWLQREFHRKVLLFIWNQRWFAESTATDDDRKRYVIYVYILCIYILYIHIYIHINK